MRKNQIGHNTWTGYIDLENVDAIVERLNKMFMGKFFTVAISNTYYTQPHCEVITSQRFDKPIVANRQDDYVSFSLHGYVVHGQVDRRESTFAKLEGNYQFWVIFKAPAGNEIKWVFAVEDHSGYD